MPLNRKPRCFVAMAFDQDDTDAIYDKVIETVLKRNDVTPIIINRREDNRDINHQIIEQLDRADFCIVDLTYTRPSVYFEAGYAQRKVEVIYTVRSDHLRKNQPENQRVHFDLQMKPLIKWADPNDPTFAKRLERRLKQTVLRAWKARSRQIENDKREKEMFLAMSMNDKLGRLRSIAIHSLHKKGFREWCIHCSSIPPSLRRKFGLYHSMKQLPQVYRRPSHLSGLDAIFVARHKFRGHLLVSSVFVSESVTQTCLRDEIASCLLNRWEPIQFYVGYDDADRAKIKTSEEHHIIASLNNVPSTRIMKVMPNLSFDLINNRYSMNTNFSLKHIFDQKPYKEIKRQLHFYFLAKIVSEPNFCERLDHIMSQIKIITKPKSGDN